MKALQTFGFLIGRIALGLAFLVPGIMKIMYWDGTLQYMHSAGIEGNNALVLLALALILEVVGGLALIFGCRTRLFATLLFLYMIPVTIIFHAFWKAEPADQQMQTINFLKNLGIIGGLIYVAAIGAGSIACDHFRRKEPKIKENQ